MKKNNTYYAFGKDGGIKLKSCPTTIRELLVKSIKDIEDKLSGSRCIFEKYFRMYNNAKHQAKEAFTYDKEGKAFENWKDCSENLYQLKLKVIEYTNKIKELKCELYQSKALLSLYDAKKIK